MSASTKWSAIVALNAVSALSQIGQFGIGFVVLPLWLSHQGLDARSAGIFAAVQWAGMLGALFAAPVLISLVGSKNTVLLGLLLSVIAFSAMPLVTWPLWLVPGLLTGIGIGLRWIANETWLLRLVPAGASGRVVGVHEALIAAAGVVGPALPMWLGIEGYSVFLAGGAFTAGAALPLILTPYEVPATEVTAGAERDSVTPAPAGAVILLGVVAASVGGLGDGALYGLFPIFSEGHGLSIHQTTVLLTLLGVGAVGAQLPVGWCADRFGLTGTVVACAIACAIAASSLMLGIHSWWLAAASALLLGGMNAAFLTLGVYAAASSGAAGVVHHMKLVSVAFTAGSIAGPLVAGMVMNVLGADMLMWQMFAISGAVMIFAASYGRASLVAWSRG